LSQGGQYTHLEEKLEVEHYYPPQIISASPVSHKRAAL
jgi:hypothetical protein